MLVCLLPVSLAHAESWCASPLDAHEWGVQVFAGDGTALPPSLSTHFHRQPPSRPRPGAPVRHLPADSGTRALPVLHFYSGGSLSGGSIPVAVEVGFTEGDALAWYPQVDERRAASVANGAAARRARRQLVERRQRREPFVAAPPLDGDPTAQLIWNALTLTPAPLHTPARASEPWVDTLRDFGALWVNGAESERFVFYEATTRERVALALVRESDFREGYRHYRLENRSDAPVHDVFVTHREGARVFVFFAPSIPAGRSAGFVLEQHRATDVAAPTRSRLVERLVDAAQPTPPTSMSWGPGNCVMMRDPAVPTTESEGHRLYAHEVDAILDVWSATFFGGEGTTIVYREDTAYLDRVMPLSIYTDMYNHVRLRRLGLAVWRSAAAPT
ncbi:MAG: hypothetical protein R3B99_06270 [Polyangiales bacterium]